jgi:hypothetical protein
LKASAEEELDRQEAQQQDRFCVNHAWVKLQETFFVVVAVNSKLPWGVKNVGNSQSSKNLYGYFFFQ